MNKLICLLVLFLSVTLVVCQSTTSNETSSSNEIEESSESSDIPEESLESTSTEPSATTPEWENSDTCIGECPEIDAWDSVYLPNERCDKFCQCSNGQAYVLSCPDNLHFSVELNVCDWPVAANCTGIGGVAEPAV